MIDTFLKYLQFERRYSPRTLVSYQTDLCQFESYLKKEFESTPAEANYGMVRGWIVTLSDQQLDPASINRKIACLRSFYKFLLKQEVITKEQYKSREREAPGSVGGGNVVWYGDASQ